MKLTLIDETRFGDTCVKEAIATLAGQLAVGDVAFAQVAETKDGGWVASWGDMGFTRDDQTEANVEAAVREAVEECESLPFDVEDRMSSEDVAAKILGY